MNLISNAGELAGAILSIVALAGAIVAVIVNLMQLREGQKCILRSEILRIYYDCCESKTIRQYKFENLTYLYKAYKALHGNSFVDKVWHEAQEWTVVT